MGEGKATAARAERGGGGGSECIRPKRARCLGELRGQRGGEDDDRQEHPTEELSVSDQECRSKKRHGSRDTMQGVWELART